jgi:ATP-dependent Clp protease adaptor protein ClpS
MQFLDQQIDPPAPRAAAPGRHSARAVAAPIIASDTDKGGKGKGEAGIVTKAKPKTKRPSLYKVLMLNDDYTPMEFVVYVLERFFNLDHGRAVEIMLTVHNKGIAVVGVYPFEVAETKVTQVMDCARSNQHPLQCTMEKE